METTGYVQESIDEFKEGLGWLSTELPEVGKAWTAFSGACFQPGAMAEKDKHLIALAIGVYSQDEYCIMYHSERALALGASDRELLETVAVCGAFGGGAALTQGVTLIRDVLEEHGTHAQH